MIGGREYPVTNAVINDARFFDPPGSVAGLAWIAPAGFAAEIADRRKTWRDAKQYEAFLAQTVSEDASERAAGRQQAKDYNPFVLPVSPALAVDETGLERTVWVTAVVPGDTPLETGMPSNS